MFLKDQNFGEKSYYKKMLGSLGSLSKLFSNSPSPYLGYRLVENLFCRSFNAENLSRSDCSADAKKGKVGIGIKTFLENNSNTMQKVAEFNAHHELFRNMISENKIIKVAELRNERILSTKRIFGIDEMIYHCVTRKPNGIMVYETPMDLIDIESIKVVKSTKNKNQVYFTDNKNEYNFDITKSVLKKRFLTKNIEFNEKVKILNDPFEAIEKMLEWKGDTLNIALTQQKELIFLPLYSIIKREKRVPESSGLNQWNAKGRKRHSNESYIPIPSWIHKKYPNFFPKKDDSFDLILPNGKTLKASLCQQNRKALMTNPNSALGEWLLRDVMNLEEKEPLTYKILEILGLDSVIIHKVGLKKYNIEFAKIGSFEEFKEKSLS